MMKKIIMAAFGLLSFTYQVQAQPKKPGAIQFEATFDPGAMAAASGMKLPEEVLARLPKSSKMDFELLFTPTNASYMKVDEVEDSNGGGGGMRFGGFASAANHEYYYSFADHKLTDVFDLSDTTYFLPSVPGVSNAPVMGMGAMAPLAPPVVTITKSPETKKIIGFDCHKAIYTTVTKRKILEEEKEITEVVNVWYTNDLGFDFTPDLKYWTEGSVLAIEGKAANVVAKSIEYRNVSSKDVSLPKKGTLITPEQYKAKMELRMKQRSNKNGQGGVRSITIN